MGQHSLIGRFRAHVTVALIAVLTAIVSGSVWSAAAQDYAGIQFGPFGKSSSSNTYDREFIREWEANPPKGFATLSKSNIEPTKAAVKRYTAVVAAGGWGVLPDVQMQAGISDPSVVIMRHRLAATG